jgi:transcriptional regulator GlxA family with amidase domain
MGGDPPITPGSPLPSARHAVDRIGVSLRQADRHIKDFVASFALVGQGWRPTTRHLRLKMATLLLSAEGASVAEVASAVGYRSSDAMARAFRDAGMQPPTIVKEQMRAVR